MKQFLVKGISNLQADKLWRIATASLQRADPRVAVRQALSIDGNQLKVAGQMINLADFRRIRVVGAGKAARAMARGLLDVLEGHAVEGVIITKHVDAGEALPEAIRVLPGGHPLPTQASVTSAQALVDFLQSGGAGEDLIFCLISGGGSALMTLPQAGVTLEDMQALTRLLLACGADIGEINTLRKHLDQVKGGGLARLAARGSHQARLVTLILSDVIGSPLEVIASGPTVADPSTYQDALAILHKYHLLERVPGSIRAVLEDGAAGRVPESLKPGDPALAGVTNCLVASNPQAAEAGLAQARAEGFHTLLLSTYLQGEAAQVGVVLAGILREIAASGRPLERPACIIAGGETTVTLRGSGLGGRNQELALGALPFLASLQDVALLSLAMDGEDGPTDAAGALVTGETLAQARQLGIDPQAYLQANDSYHFFAQLGALIQPGPTGTNVNDLVFLFAF